MLLTKELAKKIPCLGSQEKAKQDAICYAHYFYGSRDWYVLEYDWSNELFGIVVGAEIEYWPFFLSEFKEINKKAWYSKIERDLYRTPVKVIEIYKLQSFLRNMRMEKRRKIIARSSHDQVEMWPFDTYEKAVDCCNRSKYDLTLIKEFRIPKADWACVGDISECWNID